MSRPIRIEFPGAVYHVTARGNERRKTFRDDQDRRQFLAALEQAVEEHGLRVHGVCLMPNHYHLLVETPRAKKLGAGSTLIVDGARTKWEKHVHVRPIESNFPALCTTLRRGATRKRHQNVPG